MNNQYDDMTLDELSKENLRLQEEKERIRTQQVDLNRVYSRKVAEAEARRKVSAMSDDERAALSRLIGSKGISSAEKVGNV